MISETDGLRYLEQHFDQLFERIGIDFRSVPTLLEHHEAFFESSKVRVDRLRNEGNEFLGDIAVFRKVFENRTGITVSTIHGVKGAEYDTVIAYALLEGMVPHFNDPDGQDSAMRLLYVIASRARKHLHLIAERGRVKNNGDEYSTTFVLDQCQFAYDQLPQGTIQVFRRGTSS
jgi:superfamily I DNA/RNA helicase